MKSTTDNREQDHQDLALRFSRLARQTREDFKNRPWKRPLIEALENQVRTAAWLLDQNQADFERRGLYRRAFRDVRKAQLRLALGRNRPGPAFALVDGHDIEPDDEETPLAIDAAQMLGLPYPKVKPLFQRLRSFRPEEDYRARRDAYLAAVKDDYRILISRFVRVYRDASLEAENDLRNWILKEGLAENLSWDDLLRLDRRLAVRTRAYPDKASLAHQRLRAIVLMTRARTLDQHAFALARYQEVRSVGGYDRSLEAVFNRFYSRYVYLIHTCGQELDVQQPLEREEFWLSYCDDYQGMTALQATPFWRETVARERRQRAIRQAARDPRISSVAFISNTPKFGFTLMDLFRESGRTLDFVSFDVIEGYYRDRRILDLIGDPPERLPGAKLRADLLNNPLFQPVFNADTIVVDFANRAAVWASHYVRPHQKLFIRLHAYEAFSKWPYGINWGAVDGIIYVSDAIKRIFEREMGDRLDGVASIVVPNFKRLPQATTDRAAGDHRRLGMLGAIIYRKQPVQALAILDQLQRRDSPEWELRLAGTYWPDETVTPETEHKAEFERIKAGLPNPDSVKIDGFQTDIAGWFDQVDFLISASLREGTHEAVNEAMHFGAIPVVRNWPLVAEFGGAECVYPPLKEEGLLYDTVDEAVEGILRARENYLATSQRLHTFVGGYLDNDKNFQAMIDFMSAERPER